MQISRHWRLNRERIARGGVRYEWEEEQHIEGIDWIITFATIGHQTRPNGPTEAEYARREIIAQRPKDAINTYEYELAGAAD